MIEDTARGRLDLALAWSANLHDDDDDNGTQGEVVARHAMVWAGVPGFHLEAGQSLPLLALDPPCVFRSAAIAALEAAGTPWHPAFASTSLSGLWAAAAAGLGVSPRTAEGVPANLFVLEAADAGLPPLGHVAMRLHMAPGAPSPPAARLRWMIREAFGVVEGA